MNVTETLLAATVGLPLALLAACLVPAVRDRMPGLLWLAPLPGFAAALLAAEGEPLELGGPGAHLALELDLAGAILLGVAALLWSIAGGYAAGYLRGAAHAGRFAVAWLMALAGCLGAFIVADLATFYCALALLSLGAGGLVVHDGTPRAWYAGSMYVGLSLAGETAVLMGFVLLAAAADGSLLIRDVMAALPGSPWGVAALALLIAGFGLKAGLFPLHVWMPLAHSAAPVPASAVLSGAVVKVGLIGLIRFLPLDVALADWGWWLTAAGLFTAFYGVAIGLLQRQPKAVLAYSSVSQMGLMVAVLGMGLRAGDPDAALFAAYYASHHVLVKGALFLSVGVIAATGAARLWAKLALTAILAVGLGGLPLTGGALAKFAVKAALGEGLAGTLASVSAAGTTLLMVHFLFRVRHHVADDPHAVAPPGIALPWLALAVCSIGIPWTMYLSLPTGTLSRVLEPSTLMSGVLPVAAGMLASLALLKWGERLPRVPEGDIAAASGAVLRASARMASALERLDRGLRAWPAAALALAALALALAWAIAAR